MALKIKLHEKELVVPVIAVKCSSPDDASEQDYYLRDGWGPFVNTTVDGDTIYVEDTRGKFPAYKIVSDFFPHNDISFLDATGKIANELRGIVEHKNEDAAWEPTVKKIKNLKKDEFFTLKPIEYPKESQVWVFDGYDRSDRTYCAIKFSDIGDSYCFKGDKEVYTGFTF
ncbi:MAG: hypothetical protein IKT27_05525 [Clostridia bacterium]|nr:hypothetical protein [Clostridia bacterium]